LEKALVLRLFRLVFCFFGLSSGHLVAAFTPAFTDLMSDLPKSSPNAPLSLPTFFSVFFQVFCHGAFSLSLHLLFEPAV